MNEHIRAAAEARAADGGRYAARGLASRPTERRSGEDPSSFRGPTSGALSSDRFVRESAGPPVNVGGVQTRIDLTRPQAFYGSERATPPPAGYVPTVGATGGYVATDSAALANTIRNRSLSLGLDSAARPGELMLPTLDQSKSTGLVTLPGAFVGALVGGASPADAAKFQLVVLAGIALSMTVTGSVSPFRSRASLPLRPEFGGGWPSDHAGAVRASSA